jgi:predicted secreted Zn-dependent protease
MMFRLILFSCLISSAVVFSAPIVNRDNSTYEVSGLTVQEVRDQIDKLGPMHPTEKKRYDGITQWDLSWKYQLSRRGKIWIVTSRSVKLNIKVSVPQWVDRDKASPLVQRQWKIYQSNLVRHEQGHVNIAMGAANAVDKYIGTYGGASSMEQMRANIERNTKLLLERFRKYDVNYDKRTRHGAKQGAKFPNNLAK